MWIYHFPTGTDIFNKERQQEKGGENWMDEHSQKSEKAKMDFFHQGMENITLFAQSVIDHFDLSQYKTMVDLGGKTGYRCIVD